MIIILSYDDPDNICRLCKNTSYLMIISSDDDWWSSYYHMMIRILYHQVVQEYERAVIFRLGRLLSGGSKGPGIIITYNHCLLYDMTIIAYDHCSIMTIMIIIVNVLIVRIPPEISFTLIRFVIKQHVQDINHCHDCWYGSVIVILSGTF